MKDSCFYADQKYTKETRGRKVSKRVSVFVCGVFIFQAIFLYVPYRINFIQYTYIFFGSYLFQNIRGPTHKIQNSYFKSDFAFFLSSSLDSLRNSLSAFFSIRFNLALVVSDREIKGVEGTNSQNESFYFRSAAPSRKITLL